MIEGAGVLGVAVARELCEVAEQGIAIAVDEARKLGGEISIEGAVAAEVALIEEADVELGVAVVDLGAFGGGADGMAHAEAGIPKGLEERGDGLFGSGHEAFALKEQEQIDIGVRKKLAA